MSALFRLPSGYNDWRLTLGAASHLGRLAVVLLVAGAAIAIALSALSLIEERRARGGLLFALRVLGIAACLLMALQPTVELRQVTHVPNRVAVLVDGSRSMAVRPPDGGASRAERAATLLERAAPRLAAWQQAGHEVDLYTFGESVAPANAAVLREPSADATRIGEALGDAAGPLRRPRSRRRGAALRRHRHRPHRRGAARRRHPRHHRGAGRAGAHRRPRARNRCAISPSRRCSPTSWRSCARRSASRR